MCLPRTKRSHKPAVLYYTLVLNLRLLKHFVYNELPLRVEEYSWEQGQIVFLFHLFVFLSFCFFCLFDTQKCFKILPYSVFQQKPVDYGANYSVLIRLKRDLVIKVLSHLPFMLETSGKPSP